MLIDNNVINNINCRIVIINEVKIIIFVLKYCFDIGLKVQNFENIIILGVDYFIHLMAQCIIIIYFHMVKF